MKLFFFFFFFSLGIHAQNEHEAKGKRGGMKGRKGTSEQGNE